MGGWDQFSCLSAKPRNGHLCTKISCSPTFMYATVAVDSVSRVEVGHLGKADKNKPNQLLRALATEERANFGF